MTARIKSRTSDLAAAMYPGLVEREAPLTLSKKGIIRVKAPRSQADAEAAYHRQRGHVSPLGGTAQPTVKATKR